MVLSIFDQSRRDQDDNRILRIDDKVYENDADMEHILRRLTMAAADADIRHKMNVEEEYFSAIEKRDTEILLRDKHIAEQKAQLTEQKAQLTEQKAQLTEQKAQLTEQKAQLTEQEAMLRTTIKMLLDAGKSPEEISSALNKDLDTVIRLSKE
jgi:septal ring factor EnvC (AmiA/AmiB activator)